MKILLIGSQLPINNGSGGTIRGHQLWLDLCAFSEVDLVTTNPTGLEPPASQDDIERYNYLGHIFAPWDCPWYLSQREMPSELRAIIDKGDYDYIFVRYYGTAATLGVFGLKNLIIDCDDCLLEVAAQRLKGRSLKETLKNHVRFWVFRFFYLKNLAKAKYALFSKKSSQVKWQPNFAMLHNRISLPKVITAASQSPSNSGAVTILFVGNLAYEPNSTGLDYFLVNIWPSLVSARPNARLKIVGGGLAETYKQQWHAIRNIELCGFVEDIESVYSDIDFAIAPVYRGSGTHIKILESLIRKKTLAISKLAQRGYEETLVHQQSLLVANSNQEFAENMIALIDSPQLRNSLAANGFEQVMQHYAMNPQRSALQGILAY